MAPILENSNGIWELRINHSPGYRVYFAKTKNTIVLLLCGGNKKTQPKDIERAKKYWIEWKVFYEKNKKNVN